MTVFAAQGEPRRSMALLWRTAGSRRAGPGPKPRLSVDAIVEAAIAVADAEGMARLSMRAVGERLGRTAMALYTYVPSKGDLFDLMYDHVLAELPRRYATDGGWRAAATAWAVDLWEFHLRHPWVLQISQARPILGPNEFAVAETVAGILRPTGLPPAVRRRVVGTLFHFVRGVAQTVADTREAPAATGLSDEDWWYARSAVLEEVAPDFATRFPELTRLESEGGYRMEDETVPYLEQEARETFTTGLAVILDGVEAVLARSRV